MGGNVGNGPVGVQYKARREEADVKELQLMLKSKNVDERRDAAAQLVMWATNAKRTDDFKAIIPFLTDSLIDKDSEVRRSIVKALVLYGPDGAQILKERMVEIQTVPGQKKPGEYITDTISALSELKATNGEKDAIKLLHSLFNNNFSSVNIGLLAIQALGDIGSKDALKVLNEIREEQIKLASSRGDIQPDSISATTLNAILAAAMIGKILGKEVEETRAKLNEMLKRVGKDESVDFSEVSKLAMAVFEGIGEYPDELAGLPDSMRAEAKLMDALKQCTFLADLFRQARIESVSLERTKQGNTFVFRLSINGRTQEIEMTGLAIKWPKGSTPIKEAGQIIEITKVVDEMISSLTAAYKAMSKVKNPDIARMAEAMRAIGDVAGNALDILCQATVMTRVLNKTTDLDRSMVAIRRAAENVLVMGVASGNDEIAIAAIKSLGKLGSTQLLADILANKFIAPNGNRLELNFIVMTAALEPFEEAFMKESRRIGNYLVNGKQITRFMFGDVYVQAASQSTLETEAHIDKFKTEIISMLGRIGRNLALESSKLPESSKNRVAMEAVVDNTIHDLSFIVEGKTVTPEYREKSVESLELMIFALGNIGGKNAIERLIRFAAYYDNQNVSVKDRLRLMNDAVASLKSMSSYGASVLIALLSPPKEVTDQAAIIRILGEVAYAIKVSVKNPGGRLSSLLDNAGYTAKRALDSQDAAVRREAVIAYAKLSNNSSGSVSSDLAELASKDRDLSVRAEACRAIGRLGIPVEGPAFRSNFEYVISKLERLSNDEAIEVRAQALLASSTVLTRYAADLRKMSKGSIELEGPIVDRLRPKIVALANQLMKEDADLTVKIAAAESLLRLGEAPGQIRETLLGYAYNRENSVNNRAMALHALRTIKPSETEGTILNEDQVVRLREFILSTPTSTQANSLDQIAWLREFIEKPKKKQRNDALAVIAQLKTFISSELPKDERANALKQVELLQSFVALATSPKPMDLSSPRANALQRIAELGGQIAAIKPSQTPVAVGAEGIRILAMVDPTDEAVRNALDSSNPLEIRLAAAQSMESVSGNVSDVKDAKRRLELIAINSNENKDLRIAALNALAPMAEGDRSLAKRLNEVGVLLDSDPRIKTAAVTTLARTGGSEMAEVLAGRLGDQSIDGHVASVLDGMIKREELSGKRLQRVQEALAKWRAR
jgi:hypothetical protein